MTPFHQGEGRQDRNHASKGVDAWKFLAVEEWRNSKDEKSEGRKYEESLKVGELVK